MHRLIPADRCIDRSENGRTAGISLLSRAAAPPTPRAHRSARWAAGITLAATGAAILACAHAAQAKEYFVGGPVHVHDMEIVANYLVGIEMAPMPPGMPMGADVIHLEADVHATADNVYGYPDGAWVPYLTIDYKVEKLGSNWQADGKLVPMTAKDGPHYANNVQMDGPGKYRVTYQFTPPEADGFLRHTDKETGVPPWWAPFSQSFTFDYPQK